MSRTFRHNRRDPRKRERDTYHRNTHTSRGCSHGGSCGWCTGDRTFSSKRRAQSPL